MVEKDSIAFPDLFRGPFQKSGNHVVILFPSEVLIVPCTHQMKLSFWALLDPSPVKRSLPGNAIGMEELGPGFPELLAGILSEGTLETRQGGCPAAGKI
jgi:hypothetical protein